MRHSVESMAIVPLHDPRFGNSGRTPTCDGQTDGRTDEHMMTANITSRDKTAVYP